MFFTLFSLFFFTLFISVHGTNDLAKDCIEALYTGSITAMCVKAAKQKWNLGTLNLATSTQSSCCAMYEALDCLQKSSCNICPQKDLHDTAQYRIRALIALGETLCRDTPYNASFERCNVSSVVPLQQHCTNELQSSTEVSSFKGALILGLVMLAILIFVAVLGLAIHLLALGAEEEQVKPKKNMPDRRSGSSTFKLHRSQTFSSGRFLPVRRVPRASSSKNQQLQASCRPSVSASTPAKAPVLKKETSAKESSSKTKKSAKEKHSSRRGKSTSLTKLPSKGSITAKTKDVKK